MTRSRLELVQCKHGIERELRHLGRRERINVEGLREALDVIAKYEPATGLSAPLLLETIGAQR